MPGPTIIGRYDYIYDYTLQTLESRGPIASERNRLAQAIADRHSRRFEIGMNTCETDQCQCKEIARLVNNGFERKGTPNDLNEGQRQTASPS